MLVVSSLNAASAANLESLIMPGEVISGHAEFEQDCKSCHTRFSKVAQRTLCLDCHEDIAHDLDTQQGYHSRIPNSATTSCTQCHTDHRGRDADIVRLNTLTFDHDQTDFRLLGSHANQPCTQCHQPGDRHREAPTECISCHKEDDRHQGRLGEQCADCHDSARWSATRFDHDQTDFVLDGKHRKVACASCHVNERYENTPTTCNSCHALNDVHAGGFGTRCDSCHSTREWNQVRFDHDQTDFPLRDTHAKASCSACHSEPATPGSHSGKAVRTCYSCHRNEDIHLGRNGKQCDNCHRSDSWSRERFDHGKTDFPLGGKHDSLQCTSCHKGNLYQDKLDVACHSCHRTDDVHQGQLGEQCERCHQDSGWGEQIVFDHDLTRLPLIGLHATLACESCHLSSQFQDAPLNCVDCHQADDVHKQTLGTACADCHNPNGWRFWRFDHDRQTDFPLRGAHDRASCDACHRTPQKDRISQSQYCHSCHQKDDVHRGRFGQNCQRCHNEESFRSVRMP